MLTFRERVSYPILTLAALGALTVSACGGGSTSGSGSPGGGAGGAGGGSGSSAGASGSGSAGSAGGSSGSASSAGGSGGNGNASNPCTLLSASDLQSAYGAPFGDGQDATDSVAGARGFKACKWAATSGSGNFLLQTVASGGGLGESASELYDQSISLYDGATPGGVGDKSILLKDGGGFIAVQGEVFVQGNPVIGGDRPDGAAATLLKTVVGKLK